MFPISNSPFSYMGAASMPPLANRSLTGAEAQMVQSVVMQAQLSVNFSSLLDGFQSPQRIGDVCGGWQMPCCPMPPMHSDHCHPEGSLKTDNNGVVTTPGGYKIESTDKYAWKITGPDGKVTSVSGDPHVAESDGGKWDFKRDSTFVLGDGTRVNVSTKPYGNGATVTSGLDIISGNDRVDITGIDAGKGQTGQVMHDGFAHANSFGNKDVFVMGRDSDDWSYQGKEIIGSDNQGESFRLGNDLPAGVQHRRGHHGHRGGPHFPPIRPWPGMPGMGGGMPGMGGGMPGMGGGMPILPGEPAPGTQPMPGMQGNPYLQQMQMMLRFLMQQCQAMSPFSEMLGQRNCGCDPFCAPGTGGPWMDRRQNHLGNCFNDVSSMAQLYFEMNSLSRSVQSLRGGFMA